MISKIDLKSLYEQDLCLWLETTAQLLKEHRFQEIDLDNLIDEIEGMVRRDKRELKNRLTTVIEHLLKLIYWTAEKDYNARGWRVTVVEQRRKLIELLTESPSLKPLLKEIFLDCYQAAREDTIKKYKLPLEMFPSDPSFTLEDVLNADYLPESEE